MRRLRGAAAGLVALLILAVASPVSATTPTVVRSASGSSGGSSTTLTLTFGSGGTATAGHLLVFFMAGDKDTGALTMTGWTIDAEQHGSSVSLYAAHKVAAGGETGATATWATSSAAGNSGYVAELDDAAVSGGTWELAASALTTYSDSNVTSRSSGTTGAVSHEGLALGFWGVDSSQSVTASSQAYSGSYGELYAGTGLSGKGALFVASLAVTSGTTASTFTYSGTADQTAGGVVVYAEVPPSATPTPTPTATAGPAGPVTIDEFTGSALDEIRLVTFTVAVVGGLSVLTLAWLAVQGVRR